MFGRVVLSARREHDRTNRDATHEESAEIRRREDQRGRSKYVETHEAHEK